MITTRIAAAIAAGALAVGTLVGSAGTILLQDASAPRSADLAAHISQMGSLMNKAAGMMNGAGGMMNGVGGGMMNGANGTMNGSGGMMNGTGGTGPAASVMPDWIEHHPATSPDPTR